MRSSKRELLYFKFQELEKNRIESGKHNGVSSLSSLTRRARPPTREAAFEKLRSQRDDSFDCDMSIGDGDTGAISPIHCCCWEIRFKLLKTHRALDVEDAFLPL